MSKHFALVFWVCMFSLSGVTFARGEVTNNYPPTKHFTGRKLYLGTLDKLLEKRGDFINLTGLPGIGKTQLLRAYFSEKGGKYDILWWLDCSKDLDYQLNELIEELSLGEKSKFSRTFYNFAVDRKLIFLDALCKEKGFSAVFVFDNAENKAEVLRNLTLKLVNPQVKIIMASRKQLLSEGYILQLKPLDKVEALELIDKISKQGNLQQEFHQLVDLVNGHPLALTQIVGRLNNTLLINAEKYISILQNSKVIHKASYLDDSYNGTFDEVMQAVIEDIKHNSLEAYKLLLYMAYLDNYNIPESLIRALYKKVGKYTNESEAYYMKAVEILFNYSIFNVMETMNKDKKETHVNIHNLVNNAIYSENEKNGKHKENIEDIAQTFMEMLPGYKDILQYSAANPEVITNLVKFLDHADELKIKTKEIFQLKVSLLNLRMDQLYYKEVDKLIANIDNFIENSPENLFNHKDTKSALAHYYWRKGFYLQLKYKHTGEAPIVLYSKAATLMENIGELEGYYGITVQLALAKLFIGDLEGADELLEKVDLNIYKSRLYFYYHVKAVYELERGNLSEALKLIDKSIDGNKLEGQVYTPLQVASFLLKTEILVSLGNVKKALETFLPFYQVINETFGKEHELSVRVLSIKALVEVENGDIQAAEITAKEAFSILTKSQEDLQNSDSNNKDSNVARLYVIMGELAAHSSDFKKAFDYYTKAYRIYSDRYKDNMKLERLGILYEKLVHISLKLKDNYYAKLYYNLHKDTFSFSHPRTIKLFDNLSANRIL